MDRRVEPATPEDEEIVISLWKEYTEEMTRLMPFWRPPDPQAEEEERKHLRTFREKGGQVLLARADGVPVGMLWAIIEEMPPQSRYRRGGQISQVYVRLEHRRRGLTKLMLDAALEHFRSHDVHLSTLYVMEDNPEAIETWKKLGYTFVAHYMRREI